ncbi:MAG TPA: TetR family transcriptional regulator [Candidatus Acidoferrum sp.]|nr:TetR family transcriptional regulator [Candidatus Acidoferrum sp.]
MMRMTRRAKQNGRRAGRNPARTRERILAAALQEFAARGFAGSRVDAIARRAAINKRMLYHYFGDKEGLFRAVLRRKIAERQAWAESLSGDPTESLPFWFETTCHDRDWVRLLEWEALQGGEHPVMDERQRQAATNKGLKRLRQQQVRGQIAGDLDPRHVMLAMRSLTMFPVAFPQLTKLIMGRPVSDPRFQRERIAFLKKFAAAFRPERRHRVKPNGGKTNLP